MDTWLVPYKAAKFIKEKNPDTKINDRTLRKLIKSGFPCLKIDSMTLINIETFDQDLIQFSKEQMEKEKEQAIEQEKIYKIKNPIRRVLP